MMRKYRIYAPIIVVLALFAACKKDKGGGTTPPPPPAIDKVKDTTIGYTRDIYLWYNQIPSTFDAQKYADPDKIMTAIRAYSKEPGFTAAVDRWSFAMKKAEWDNTSSGISGDFGLGVFFKAEGDLRVKAVEKASPAGIKGIKRGWR
ncbi:MAG TPA: hypothetical protein VJT83_10465, partial [Chitinophagaceae bacterium]|nr:hypothetical protein [Chitinophagaceae bacterium]